MITDEEIAHIAERIAQLREPKGAQKFVTVVTPWLLMIITVIALPWCVWVTRSIMVLDPSIPRWTTKDAELQRLGIESNIASTMNSQFARVDSKLDALRAQSDAKGDLLKVQLEKINLSLAKKGIE